MIRNEKVISIRNMIVFTLLLINGVILKVAYLVNEKWYWALVVSIPLFLIAILDIRQKKSHTSFRPGNKGCKFHSKTILPIYPERECTEEIIQSHLN